MGITLQQYLDLKESKKLQIFIFLLGNEYPYLDNDTTWLHGLQIPVHLVRMPVEEFNQMDFAVHPKLMCTRNGKELFEMNGLPSIKQLQQKLSHY